MTKKGFCFFLSFAFFFSAAAEQYHLIKPAELTRLETIYQRSQEFNRILQTQVQTLNQQYRDLEKQYLMLESQSKILMQQSNKAQAEVTNLQVSFDEYESVVQSNIQRQIIETMKEEAKSCELKKQRNLFILLTVIFCSIILVAVGLKVYGLIRKPP